MGHVASIGIWHWLALVLTLALALVVAVAVAVDLAVALRYFQIIVTHLYAVGTCIVLEEGVPATQSETFPNATT